MAHTHTHTSAKSVHPTVQYKQWHAFLCYPSSTRLFVPRSVCLQVTKNAATQIPVYWQESFSAEVKCKWLAIILHSEIVFSKFVNFQVYSFCSIWLNFRAAFSVSLSLSLSLRKSFSLLSLSCMATVGVLLAQLEQWLCSVLWDRRVWVRFSSGTECPHTCIALT